MVSADSSVGHSLECTGILGYAQSHVEVLSPFFLSLSAGSWMITYLPAPTWLGVMETW